MMIVSILIILGILIQLIGYFSYFRFADIYMQQHSIKLIHGLGGILILIAAVIHFELTLMNGKILLTLFTQFISIHLLSSLIGNTAKKKSFIRWKHRKITHEPIEET